MTDRLAKSECVVVLPLSPEETCVVVLPPPPKAHDDCHCVFDHPQGSFGCRFGLGEARGGSLGGPWGGPRGSLGVLGRFQKH